MALYMEYSTRIYNIYLKYIAPEDIHVYSIDEVFMDVTAYRSVYKMTAHELAMTIIKDVLRETGITATAGIGTNLYLCKAAMDIVAKHIPPDKDGVRIAELDEMSYKRLLWGHRPITDFWRVGHGTAKKLADKNIFTMGDVAELSLRNEDLLFRLFGVNAELLIDHAWGYEPCTIADIKAYHPEENSISQGQVLERPYEYDKAELIVREMADSLSLELVEKGLCTDQIVLTVGYDVMNLKNDEQRQSYRGEVTIDRYGRAVPKHSHGTANLKGYTASSKEIAAAAVQLFERISSSGLLVRRMNITANHVITEAEAEGAECCEQLDLFTDAEETIQREKSQKREKNMQRAIVKLKQRYGKNAVVKGMNLQEGATAISRNGRIGGHKA